MPTSLPRVQVTLDPELQAAMAAAAPVVGAKSQAALIRNLALRGAAQVTDEAAGHAEARELLQAIARGQTSYDPAGALAAHAQRDQSR